MGGESGSKQLPQRWRPCRWTWSRCQDDILDPAKCTWHSASSPRCWLASLYKEEQQSERSNRPPKSDAPYDREQYGKQHRNPPHVRAPQLLQHCSTLDPKNGLLPEIPKGWLQKWLWRWANPKSNNLTKRKSICISFIKPHRTPTMFRKDQWNLEKRQMVRFTVSLGQNGQEERSGWDWRFGQAIGSGCWVERPNRLPEKFIHLKHETANLVSWEKCQAMQLGVMFQKCTWIWNQVSLWNRSWPFEGQSCDPNRYVDKVSFSISLHKACAAYILLQLQCVAGLGLSSKPLQEKVERSRITTKVTSILPTLSI